MSYKCEILAEVKICKLCGISLSIDKFSKWKYSADGHKHWCKECTKKRSRENRIAKGLKVNIDRSIETPELKICTNCEELKPRKEFNTSSCCVSCRVIANRIRTGGKEKIIPIINDTSKECLKCHKILDLEMFTNNPRGRKNKAAYCKDCSLIIGRAVSLETKRKYSRKHWNANLEHTRSLHRLRQAKRKYKLKNFRDIKVTTKVLDNLFNTSKECYYCKTELTTDNRSLEHIFPISKGGRHVIGNLAISCKSCNFSKGGKTKMEFLKYKLCTNVK